VACLSQDSELNKVSKKFYAEFWRLLITNLTILISLCVYLRLELSKINKIWLPNTDLIGTYTRIRSYRNNDDNFRLNSLTDTPLSDTLIFTTPQAQFFSRLIEFLLSRIFESPIVAGNISLLLGFFIIGNFTFILTKILKIEPLVLKLILVLSITFLPIHFFLLRYGLSSSDYSPLVVSLIILILVKREIKNKRNFRIVFLLSIYISMSNLYYIEAILIMLVLVLIHSSFLKIIIEIKLILFSISTIILFLFLQVLIDIYFFGAVSEINLNFARVEDLAGPSSPFRRGGGFFWSMLILNPFTGFPIISKVSAELFEFVSTHLSYFNSCSYDNDFKFQYERDFLCFLENEKIVLVPLVIHLAVIFFAGILFFRSKLFIFPDNMSKFLFVLLAMSVTLWIEGGILSIISTIFPLFRSYSRINVYSLIIALLFIFYIINYLVSTYLKANILKSFLYFFLFMIVFIDQISRGYQVNNLTALEDHPRRYDIAQLKIPGLSKNCTFYLNPSNLPSEQNSVLIRFNTRKQYSFLINTSYNFPITEFMSPNSSAKLEMQNYSKLNFEQLINSLYSDGYCGILNDGDYFELKSDIINSISAQGLNFKLFNLSRKDNINLLIFSKSIQ
jgi:hypothetical protein